MSPGWTSAIRTACGDAGFGRCPSIQRHPSPQRRHPEQGTRTRRTEQPVTAGAPGRRHRGGQRDVHGDHQHASEPHSAQGGGPPSSGRVPLGQAEARHGRPRTGSDARPRRKAPTPSARPRRPAEPARARSVTQHPVCDESDGHQQLSSPSRAATTTSSRHALGSQASGRKPRQTRRRRAHAAAPPTPRRRGADQQQHRDQRAPTPTTTAPAPETPRPPAPATNGRPRVGPIVMPPVTRPRGHITPATFPIRASDRPGVGRARPERVAEPGRPTPINRARPDRPVRLRAHRRTRARPPPPSARRV